jgi:FtsP/CotA-like multicopper oxidase with cupredoxin domain
LPNDNRTVAGKLQDSVLTLRLVAQRATWYPEGPEGCGVTLYAFAEEGKAAQIPGPLLRVAVGTEVRITLRNGLAAPIAIWGLQDPGRANSGEPLTGVTLPADSTWTVAFRPSTPGTYYYWANPPANRAPIGPSAQIFAQMTGGFIVDPPGESGGVPGERILVMTRWRGNPGPAPRLLFPGGEQGGPGHRQYLCGCRPAPDGE